MELAGAICYLYGRIAGAFMPGETCSYTRYGIIQRRFFGDYLTITKLAKLNANWHKVINYPITQLLGDTWLRKMETAVLKVPSAIIDMEYNYLLNPAHPDFEKIKISSVSKFTFDPRLKAH